jgi:hypothetical protein
VGLSRSVTGRSPRQAGPRSSSTRTIVFAKGEQKGGGGISVGSIASPSIGSGRLTVCCDQWCCWCWRADREFTTRCSGICRSGRIFFDGALLPSPRPSSIFAPAVDTPRATRGRGLISLSPSRRATAPIGDDLLAVLGSDARQRTSVAIQALPSARGRAAVLDNSS